MKSAIADNVKAIIRDKCLKQGVVAEKAEYNYKAFSNMLNGRKVIADIDVINIAKALNVTPNELFGIEKNEFATHRHIKPSIKIIRDGR